MIICVVAGSLEKNSKNDEIKLSEFKTDRNCVNLQHFYFKYIGQLLMCHFHLSSMKSSLHTPYIQQEFRDEMFRKTIKNPFLIKAISISRMKSLTQLPSGINSSFPNIKAFTVKMTNLSRLNPEDIEQFGNNLEWIDFSSNKLTALQGDLFNSTPKLVFIDLSYNPLTHINPKLFENFKVMKELEEVEIVLSSCISRKYIKNRRDNIQTFKWHAKNCNQITTQKKLK